jgi:hypothetical protein
MEQNKALSFDDLKMEEEPFVEGGFARVYAGIFKGEPVAVKQFAKRGQIDILRRQFLEEALIHS